jgi:hypothetical protein
MQLNIVDIHLPSLSAQFGITDERLSYLMHQMDIIVDTYMNDEVQKSQLFQHIASICNNIEELIICVHAHDSWFFSTYGRVD